MQINAGPQVLTLVQASQRLLMQIDADLQVLTLVQASQRLFMQINAVPRKSTQLRKC